MKVNNNTFLAVSFSKGFISPNIPIATFHQGSKKLNFILDTGSDKNIIDSNILEELKYEKIESKDTIVVAGLGGTKEVSECSLVFASEEQHYKANFLISDLTHVFQSIEEVSGVVLHGLLGSTFLRDNKVVLDFTNLTAQSKDDIPSN